jgi:hypothetical protein
MTNETLAQSYLTKCRTRLKVLDLLLAEGAFSDVVREAQETVELALKGILRQVGVEPPKLHDVGGLLLDFADRLPAPVRARAKELAEVSKWLRKEREFAFYGEVDFIPTEEYTQADAERAIVGARLAVSVAEVVIGRE